MCQPKGPRKSRCQIQVSLSWLGFNLARWQDDCRLPGPGSSSRSKQEADLANHTRICPNQRETEQNKTDWEALGKATQPRGSPRPTKIDKNTQETNVNGETISNTANRCRRRGRGGATRAVEWIYMRTGTWVPD